MLGFLNLGKKLVGYKVTNAKRTKKYGIAANSLQMLMEKASPKFNLETCRVYLAKDGSEILDEAYFSTLEPQSLLVIAEPDEEIKTDFQLIYEAIQKRNSNLIEVSDLIQKFIVDNREEFDRVVKDLSDQIADNNNQTCLSEKSQHTDWFQGQDSRYNTKEEAMARRAQDRIRSYYYKTKDELVKHEIYKTNPRAKEILDRTLKVFYYLLIGCDHFSMIFDRKHKRKHPYLEDQTDSGPTPSKKLRQFLKDYTNDAKLFEHLLVSLCTERGDFYCQGLWNDAVCSKKDHIINPYSCRESLILFQVWNLDHQIEISRSVIPSIINNVETLLKSDSNEKCIIHRKKVIDLNILQYFLELFTIDNLKLVHIVCHDKGGHELKSNGRLICEKCEEYIAIKKYLAKMPF